MGVKLYQKAIPSSRLVAYERNPDSVVLFLYLESPRLVLPFAYPVLVEFSPLCPFLIWLLLLLFVPLWPWREGVREMNSFSSLVYLPLTHATHSFVFCPHFVYWLCFIYNETNEKEWKHEIKQSNKNETRTQQSFQVVRWFPYYFLDPVVWRRTKRASVSLHYLCPYSLSPLDLGYNQESSLSWRSIISEFCWWAVLQGS